MALPLSEKEFIAKAIQIHGDKYSYVAIGYINVRSKVSIMCNRHKQIFTPTASSLIHNKRPVGCPLCAKEDRGASGPRFTRESFIERSIEKHGLLYDYYPVEYVDQNTPVNIMCRIHGIFSIKPVYHIHGRGCPTCGRFTGNTVLDTNLTVTRLKNIYGDNYDYRKVVFINTMTPVKLICKKHGGFSQTPKMLFKGVGCSSCGKETFINKQKESFIAKAIKKHGDKYDYSQVVYINSYTKVKIICPVHGVFEQQPTAHLQYGCERCGFDAKILPFEKFVIKARTIHGDMFEYSDEDYTGTQNPLNIKCKKHGWFKQIGTDHFRGNGCPGCGESKGERKIGILLTKLEIDFIKEYKLPHYRYRYDFYLPELNILIEYDGVQHFNVVSHWNGEAGLAGTKERDKLKTKLASTHNMPLIRIPYTKYKDLVRYLLSAIARVYKYNRDSVYFKTFLEYAKHYDLPEDATPASHKEYNTYVILLARYNRNVIA